MGIKDLFGGGKKKSEFREKAKEVVSEGRIAPGKAEALAKLSRDHEIENPGDDKTMLRREIYNKAVGNVKGRGKLTEVEASELAKIQKFLELRDDQVEKTKWDLARLRQVTEIRSGRLPTVSPSHVALRGVQLEPGEIAHHAVQVEIQDRPSPSGMPGVPVKWATPYVVNSARAETLPTDGAKALGEGYLLFTNKRLVLRNSAGKAAAVAFNPQANLFLYGDGLRIERTVGNTILRFRSKADGTSELVGELLAALMR